MTPRGIAIHVLSDLDDVIAIISDETDVGAILDPEIIEEKQGGLVSLSFTLPDDTSIPLYTNMKVKVYAGGAALYAGYISRKPEKGTAEKKLIVECSGYSQRLKRKQHTVSFTGVTLAATFAELSTELEDADVHFLASLLTLPSVTIDSLEFVDKTLFEIITELMAIANDDDEEEPYRWYIDADRYLIVKPLASGVVKTMYEGFQFQAPEIETDIDLVNVVHVYRARLDDPTVTEYVASYTNELSRSAYGDYELKETISEYADDASCTAIANSILARKAYPKESATLSNLVLDHTKTAKVLPFGKYSINLPPREYWRDIFNGESAAEYDDSNSSGVTFAFDSEHVFTGKRSLKCTIGATPTGYLSIPITPTLFRPKLVRFYLYGPAGAEITVTMFGADSEERSITLVFDEGRWSKNEYRVGSEAIFNRVLAIDGYAVALDGRTIYAPSKGAISTINEIRFVWSTPSTTIWIDRVDILTNQYKRLMLQLIRAKYRGVKGAFITEATLGAAPRTTESELTSIKESTKTLYDRSSKHVAPSFGIIETSENYGYTKHLFGNNAILRIGKAENFINRAIYRFAYSTSVSGRYVHMKTTHQVSANNMPEFRFHGYAYGANQIVECQLAYYTYNNGVNKYISAGSHSCTAYGSSDGYVVLTIYFSGSLYFLGFIVDLVGAGPQGLLDIDIVGTTVSASATGVY